jgi:hypothetical protein
MPNKKEYKPVVDVTNVPRVSNKKAESKAIDPAALAEERDVAKRKNRTMAQRATEINSLVPTGTNRITRMFKGAATGAAVGATLGEALADWREKKAQGGKSFGPRTISEAATDSDGAEYDAEPGPQIRLSPDSAESEGRKRKPKKPGADEAYA